MLKRKLNGYVVQVDGKPGAYGVVFPDLPGCTAMGKTKREALSNAAKALREWMEVVRHGGGQLPHASAR